MALKGKFYRSDYVKQNSILEIINSFGIDKVYNFLSGTRVKPYDDRELDVFVGIKSAPYTHLRANETVLVLVCRLMLENKN